MKNMFKCSTNTGGSINFSCPDYTKIEKLRMYHKYDTLDHQLMEINVNLQYNILIINTLNKIFNL